MMKTNLQSIPPLAASITKAASRQTFYTIRFLADPERAADAFRAYAYFRWLDDCLDAESASGEERGEFVRRQKSLLESCYRAESFPEASPVEETLVELIRNDAEKNSGLRSYLFNMMAVMEFDAGRRGRSITQSELNQYTRWLALAVTEAMHYFIGHDCFAPRDETRALAVAGAHVTHMLRDTFDDVRAGYFNIPREVLEANHIAPQDVESEAYRAWVRSRANLARSYFRAGRDYLNRVESPRCRLAGYAYMARFEWLLDTIEREDFLLRPAYNERKSMFAGFRMGWLALASAFSLRDGNAPQPVPVRARTERR
ncbi:MAG: squalene/phytoene synthase family protein [Chloroflexota bacterium]